MNFEDFYKSLGFIRYPFGVVTSEGEIEVFSEIYLKPQNHSVIVEGLRSTSAIITGERGTGKTALSMDLERLLSDKDHLITRIAEFSDLPKDYQSNDLYRFVTQRLVAEFFLRYAEHPSSLWRFTKEERVDLSYFLHSYLGSSSKALLVDKIGRLQNGLLKRTGLGLYNVTRVVMNYGLHAATKIISDAVTKHFASLPPFDSGDSEYFRKLEMEVDTSFEARQREYFYLEKFCRLARKAGFRKIYVFIDKLDEDARFCNDAEEVSAYLLPLASDNKLLTSDLFHMVLFVWSTPFNNIHGQVRTQKICFKSLSWDRPELEKVLTRRLASFADVAIEDAPNVLMGCSEKKLDLLFEMCNRNPRDLWHLLDKAFQEQFRLDPSSTLGDDAIDAAVRRFVTEFNYYEYYPRRSNARSDSMDIYRYVKHLQKLSSASFTKDQLRLQAGTGGSTNNYVLAMESMGLIRKATEKAQGGANIYEIADPKVRYALENDVEISD